MAGRHEALSLQMAQCLTHSPPADAKACGHLGLPQVIPRAVLARRDRHPQGLQSALAERAAIQVCQGLHGHQVLLRFVKPNRQLLTGNTKLLPVRDIRAVSRLMTNC